MVTLEISNNKKFLKVSEWSLNSEKEAIFKYFKKKSKDAKFNILVKRGIWDGLDHFINKQGIIKIELWKEVYNFSKQTGIEVKINGIENVIPPDFNKEEYDIFVDDLFDGILTDKGKPFYPRDYQKEGAYRALKNKFCCQELATSAGKTAIFYTFCSYLNNKNNINSDNKALLIVPNISLVNQTAKAFDQYNNGMVKWNIHKIGGSDNDFNLEEFNKCNLLITTYQSLINMVPECIDKRLEKLIKKRVKKDDKDKRAEDITKLKKKLNEAKILDLFSKFKVVCVDEAHKSRGDSISDILKSCKDWEYKLGLSGTLKMDVEYSDFFKMQQNIGPLVMLLDAKFLQDNKYSPFVKIKQVYLKYQEDHPAVSEYLKVQRDDELRAKIKSQFNDPKDFGKNMLDIEKGIIFDSKERLDFISTLVKRLGKNTLILFSNIKDEYGINISNHIKNWNSKTYYIDGTVENSFREEFKDSMEKHDDVVIVASYGTFATGIDLKNVHNIIFAESTKAEITIRQAIGRGMRYLKGKDKVIIWDIVDDLDGYSIKHSKVRETIYKDQKFEVLKPKVISLADL